MENNEVVYLYLDDIIPNRFQPREVFDDQALKELAISIKEHGVIQPIIVRKVENKYEIIAGERRYKASTMAGLTKIPAIVKNLDDKESSKVALIENLQRRDLTPIEEARTYQKILELEPGMTQEQLASTMGKTQSVVSNKLRLLALPDEVQDALLKEKISERHARSLLNLSNKNDQIRMLDKVIAEKMTVRELDKEIKEMNDNQGNSDVSGGVMPSNASVAPTPVAENNNINTNIGPSMATGMNLPSFGADVSVNNTNSEGPLSSNILNPTAVDINQIRENAVDINGPKVPTVDIKDLMKDTNNEVKNDFKFISTFDEPKSDMANTNMQPTMSTESTNSQVEAPGSAPLGANSFLSSFGSSLNNSTNENTSVDNASPTTNNNSFNLGANNSMNGNKFLGGIPEPTPPLSEPNTNIASTIAPSAPAFNFTSFMNQTKKDVSPVINDIKSVVRNIETKGFKVLIEENDSDNTYQITIKVDKSN